MTRQVDATLVLVNNHRVQMATSALA